MKNFRKYVAGLCLLGIGVLSVSSCEIKEEVEDELTQDVVFGADGGTTQLVAPVYASLRDLMKQDGVFGVNEHASDEMLGPTRGQDWDDNGVWRVLHTHNWDATNAFIQNSWNDLNRGISRANSALAVLLEAEDTPENARLIAETRTLRALYSFYVLDMFGQLPFRENDDTNFTEPGQVLTGQEAFNYIETELQESIPDLGNEGEVTYGRMTKGAANTLLAVLNLNHATYLGAEDPARYEDVITYTDAVISSGNYSLADDYFSIFDNDNTATRGAGEAIIVSEFTNSEDLAVANQLFNNMTLHYNQRWGNGFSAWNGFTTIADFYNRFDESDARFLDTTRPVNGINRGFLRGQQTNGEGQFILERGGESFLVDDLADADVPGLNYTLDVDLTGNTESNGVRVIKYEPDASSPIQNRANYDYIIYRLADVYLMRAEANYRTGDNGAALADINIVRQARGVNNVSTVDDDVILNERGYELYWEGHRRRDLIRFGRFGETWNLKEQSPEFRQLFPIPQNSIDSDPNLKQNPGYAGG